MKKIVILIMLFYITFLLASCSNGIVSNPLYSEFHRISLIIPNEIDSDYNLPEATDALFITYKIDGIELVDSTIIFELGPKDKIITLEIKIEQDDKSEKYVILIKQLGNESLYNEMQFETKFEDTFLWVSSNIPVIITSNITLPIIDDDEISINYNVDCTSIIRGRLIYTFPSQTHACNLNVEVTFKGETREQDIPIILSSIEELPRIPEIYITTENNTSITSNVDYVSATLTVVANGLPQIIPLVDIELGIRLRGNSTLYMPKQSYKIKFDDKQRFLSTYREKDWILLANHVDQTLLRDYLAFAMATRLRMGFTPSYRFVDVYINGEYQGNYLLTDQIEVTNDRVDIEENVSDINTGYLIEYDIGLYRIGLENTDENYFLIDNIPFVIKSPQYEDDHYSASHKIYIENYMNNVINTLKNQEDYSSLIDESTFIDWFIVSEIFKNVDSGYSSVYFYKDKDGPLKMGPVWDFDLSSGVPGYLPLELRGPEGWYTARSDKNIFFYYLMQYPSFKANLKERWNEVYHTAIIGVLDQIFVVSDSITYSRYRNFELWDIIGKEVEWYTSPEILELETYDEQIWFLYDYLEARIRWLNEEINKL